MPRQGFFKNSDYVHLFYKVSLITDTECNRFCFPGIRLPRGRRLRGGRGGRRLCLLAAAAAAAVRPQDGQRRLRRRLAALPGAVQASPAEGLLAGGRVVRGELAVAQLPSATHHE